MCDMITVYMVHHVNGHLYKFFFDDPLFVIVFQL